jgi:hypothetical protein
MLRIAFFKGTKTGLAGIYNRGVRWIESGDCSHFELIFSDGKSASSSYMDGGIRFKDIEYDLDKWYVYDLPWADEKKARAYFEARAGKVKYNLAGNIHFVFGFIRGDTDGEFCSEACAGALGFKNPWQFPPNQLHNIVLLINERYYMNNRINPEDPPMDDDPPVDDTGGGTLPPPKKPKG